MNYTLFILPRAVKELERLPERDYQSVKAAILALAVNPRPPGCSKLKGRDGWRIRQGDYRVLYDIDDQGRSVTVLRVRHRREAYE